MRLLARRNGEVVVGTARLDGAVDVEVLGVDVNIVQGQNGAALLGRVDGLPDPGGDGISLQVDIGVVLRWVVEEFRLNGLVFGGPLPLGVAARAEEPVGIEDEVAAGGDAHRFRREVAVDDNAAGADERELAAGVVDIASDVDVRVWDFGEVE